MKDKGLDVTQPATIVGVVKDRHGTSPTKATSFNQKQ